jgi:LytS/YehU family sensor histidine kinase
MSYVLYEANTPKVPLGKEITYLHNYLDVESLRFGQRLNITFDIDGQIEQVNIPPMILILFIENSFKHGVKNNLNKINIDIALKVELGYLYFSVTNPVAEYDTTENTGIGLKNVRRRLDLLYANNYTLDTQTSNNTYTVSLKIPVW